VDVAGARPRSAALRSRRRSLRSGPAPGHRHRRAGRRACRGPRRRDSLVRRDGAGERQERDGSDRRRLFGHVDAPRVDRGAPRRVARRGRRGRRRRPERRFGVRRPLRASRRPLDERSERVPGSARLPATADDESAERSGRRSCSACTGTAARARTADHCGSDHREACGRRGAASAPPDRRAR
jgi:hypothetical protein